MIMSYADSKVALKAMNFIYQIQDSECKCHIVLLGFGTLMSSEMRWPVNKLGNFTSKNSIAILSQ